MNFLAAAWHVVDFFSPAVGVGALAAALAKLLWRRELVAVRWRRLGAWACAVSALVLVLGLAAFGRDGRMATYAAMVVACAVSLWWQGFSARRRR